MNIHTIKRIMLLPALALCGFAIGCGAIMAPVVPPMGGVYTNFNAPLDLNCQNGKQFGAKRGESSSKAIAGVVAWGDASIHAAKENGELTKIYHVDYQYTNILLGAYAKFTTVVYGE